jgi:predicted ATPase
MFKKLYDVLAEEGIHLDSYQQEFLKAYSAFQDKRQSKLKFLSKNQVIKSVYVWGKVGRGKTLLLKALSKEISNNILTTHFSEFMLQVHSFLKSHQGKKDPLTLFCKEVLQKVDILLLDEFQIEDIGDAMIIGKVFNELKKHNTAIFLSSNYPVQELYKMSFFISI